jgi:hypothetical protein
LNKLRRLIPLRVDNSCVEGSLAQFRYIDFRSDSLEKGIAELLKNLRPLAESKPSSSLKREATQSETSYADLPVGHSFTSCAEFFHDRFSSAFPGLRGGVTWIDEPAQMRNRLGRLLREPLRIGSFRPIWWYRGLGNGQITRFCKINDSTVLLDEDELQLKRIAGVEYGPYWNSFVYVEATAVAPSAANSFSSEYIAEGEKNRGYFEEEVCLFNGRYFKRAFYDDDAAEIDGEIVDFHGRAELRVRHLTAYNLLITGQDSSINNKDFDLELNGRMNALLKDPIGFDALVERIDALPKQVNYFAGR